MQAEAERQRQQNLAANQQDPGEPTDCSVRQQGYTLIHLHKNKKTNTCTDEKCIHTQTHSRESLKTHQMHIRNTKTQMQLCM